MKEKKVLDFYVTCNKLKNVIRTGWKDWNVKRNRVESVAEHIYGTQMLALAIYSEYQEEYKNLDIMKVIYMLAIHEIGEATIGDLTQFQISKMEKKRIEQEAVTKTLNGLLRGKEIEKYFIEFDEHSTEEGWFAHLCDKLECDIQSKLYDEENCVDLNDQKDSNTYNDERVQSIFKELGDCPYKWSKMWLKFGQSMYNYDKPFIEISNYAMENEIKGE